MDGKKLVVLKLKNNKVETVMSYTDKSVKTKKDINEVLAMFDGPLLKVLKAEMQAGNKICSCSLGYPKEGAVFVILDKIFQTPIQRHHQGIEFENTNDPHYWKACYNDDQRRLYIACPFNGPNFKPL